MSEHGLPEYDASQIVSTKAMAEYLMKQLRPLATAKQFQLAAGRCICCQTKALPLKRFQGNPCTLSRAG